jgi:hypothetical protein
VALLVGAVFKYELTAEMTVTQRMTQAGEAIIPILFYGFGIFVARRYSAIGLRVVCIISLFLFAHSLEEYLTRTYFDKNILELFFIIYF